MRLKHRERPHRNLVQRHRRHRSADVLPSVLKWRKLQNSRDIGTAYEDFHQMNAACSLGVVLIIALMVIFFLMNVTIGKGQATTLEGAKLSLVYIVDWAKWMAGIQTAALGFLATILINKDTLTLLSMGPHSRFLAIATFVFLGIALLCSAWVLSSASSIALRLEAVKPPSPPADLRSEDFDIYQLAIYGWLPKIEAFTLGTLFTLKHWFWCLGLIAIAGFFLSLFFAPVCHDPAKPASACALRLP